MEARRRRPRRQAEQLRLIRGDVGKPVQSTLWPLDPATRAVGLDGVAKARKALKAAHPPEDPLRQAS